MTLKGHGKFAGKLTTGSNSAQKKICEFPSSKPEGWNFKFGETGFSKTYTAPAKNCGRGFILWHWNVRANLGENWLMVSYSAQKNICQFHSSKPEGWNFKFDGMVFSQKYIGWAKNCGTSFMLSNWKAMESLGENWLMVSYSAQKKICQFHSSEPQGQNFKFDGMVFSKCYIGWAKNCGTSFMLWHWKAMESLGGKWLQVSNSAQEKICEFCSSEPQGRNLKFHGMLFSKGYIGWAKNFGRSFIWWHSRVMGSLGGKLTNGFLFSPKKNLPISFQRATGSKFLIWWDGFSKRYIGWAKSCGRSFILWHWRAMASLGEN